MPYTQCSLLPAVFFTAAYRSSISTHTFCEWSEQICQAQLRWVVQCSHARFLQPQILQSPLLRPQTLRPGAPGPRISSLCPIIPSSSFRDFFLLKNIFHWNHSWSTNITYSKLTNNGLSLGLSSPRSNPLLPYCCALYSQLPDTWLPDCVKDD